MLRGYATKATHTSLQTFLQHASVTGRSTTSTVYKGTFYEYTAIEVLSAYNLSLYRSGGASDQGIDLRGTWKLPHVLLPVVLQCKHEEKKIGPKYIRELGGAVEREQDATLAMMVSSSNYTSKAIQAMLAFRGAMGLCVVNVDGGGSSLKQLVWNAAAGELLGSLEVRLLHRKKGEEARQDIKLFHDGKFLKNVKLLAPA